MHKIYICTWHYFQNYGSQLQCLALFNYLKEKGFDVKVVDYHSCQFSKRKIVELIKRKYILYSFVCFLFNKKRSALFNSFYNKNIELTKLYYGKKSFNTNLLSCDCAIFGSDQIWAPNVFDDFYFGKYFPSSVKKITYAVSLVVPFSYKREQVDIINDCIPSFFGLSFREPISDDIKKLIKIKDYQVVCDPTLLMTDSFFRKYENKKIIKKIKNNNYDLEYLLNPSSDAVSFVRNNSGNVLVSLSNRRANNKEISLFKCAGPSEFISLIDSSSIVFTDSFHGVCLSLIFKKQFWVIERFSESDALNQNKRIWNLLKVFGLESRIISFGETKKIANTPIDFERAWKKAEPFIKSSANYLLRLINE